MQVVEEPVLPVTALVPKPEFEGEKEFVTQQVGHVSTCFSSACMPKGELSVSNLGADIGNEGFRFALIFPANDMLGGFERVAGSSTAVVPGGLTPEANRQSALPDAEGSLQSLAAQTDCGSSVTNLEID